MRKMYNTKRLMGSITAAAAMLTAAPVMTQDAGEEPLFAEEATNEKSPVNVTVTGEISLHVKELEITKVLQLLSIQSERNIIASRGVENAKVSADLYNVSFDEALTSILEPNGFGYIEEGNFIYVLTKDEIQAREDANRKPTTKIKRLDWLRADEAAAFVTPLLSENGAITASGNVAEGYDPSVSNGGSNQYAGPATLVIRDYEDTVQEIVSVLDELDKQPVNVVVEATVLRSTLTENNQFGVDFSLFTDLSGFTPLDIVDDIISSGPVDNQRLGAIESGGNFDSGSAVKLGFVAGDAAVFISALDEVTDATVVASPKVTVLDRSSTKILVGEKIAYLSTTVTETSETQTVEFLEVGTQLNVRPFVSSDGKIRLELRPSVSDATIRSIGATDAPDESTVELVTNVIVESGQTVVLGGLIIEDTSITRNQVPGLGDIPILGAAFQGQNDTINRSEVIFLVKATVVGNETLAAMGEEAEGRIDVARVAQREGTLMWSRNKNTAQQMVNARKAYDEAMSLQGEAREKKLAKALYSVDLALHLDPTMVDALMLKEAITGKASYIAYEESIVKDTYEAVLDQELKALNIPELEVEAPAPEADDTAADAGQLIEPEEVTGADLTAVFQNAETDAQPEAEGEAETQAEEPVFGTDAQADADAQWLEQFETQLLNEGTESAEEPTESADAAETETQTDDTQEWVEVQTTEVAEESPTEQTTEQTEQATEVAADDTTEESTETAEPTEEPTEVTEVPTNNAEPFSTGSDTGDSAKVFGFSWRSLTTAQLMQLAAQATEDAQAFAEGQDETAQPEQSADVPTQTD